IEVYLRMAQIQTATENEPRSDSLDTTAKTRANPALSGDAIPVFKPLIQQEEIAAAVEALEMGWLGMGSYVGQLEDALKQYLEADDRHVAVVSTGHAALHLGLLTAGVGPGDEVITPSFNNIPD